MMNLDFVPELFWVDLEMSGLDPMKHRILQFACILTDSKLQKKLEGPHFIIHCDQEHLKTMDEWCTSHHTQSGLYKACLESKLSLQQAENLILQFLRSRGILPQQLIIAGNSIHMDKLFLFHHMKNLNDFLHYRILDVSSQIAQAILQEEWKSQGLGRYFGKHIIIEILPSICFPMKNDIELKNFRYPNFYKRRITSQIN